MTEEQVRRRENAQFRKLEESKLTAAKGGKEGENKLTFYLATKDSGDPVWTFRMLSHDHAHLQSLGQEWVKAKTAKEFQITTYRVGV